MSHSLYYSKTALFYPVGNTSAICLTQDIPPEQPACILSLGCGDPRNILYTIYAAGLDQTAIPRILDFTCCDVEPAILARNLILFSLLSESDVTSIDEIWNIFYDFFLKRSCLDILITHSRRLLDCSKDLESWNRGKYGQFLKVCSCRTLAEVRQCWAYYANFDELPASRKVEIKSSFIDAMEDMQDKYCPWSVGRSAGPLISEALGPASVHFMHFWKTGINSMNAHDNIDADLVNPTFAYSTGKEGFHSNLSDLHCLATFHLALAFADIKDSPTRPPHPLNARSAVISAKTQFTAWCQAFKKVINGSGSRVVIRVFAGDALAFCDALHYCSSTLSTSTPSFVAPWKGALITLDESCYSEGASFPAPVEFDVIDTSNLTDYLGLLNVLAATIPLLARRPHSTLYTETLRSPGETAELHFKERFCGDMTTICILLDLAPSAFLSRFTITSNLHELLSHGFFKVELSSHVPQFHERMSWKILSLIDPPPPPTTGANRQLSLIFEPRHLANVLLGIYHKMFANEDPLIDYTRASYAVLLRLIRARMQEDMAWDATMDALFDQLDEDETLLGIRNYQDLCCQLHFYNVFSVHPFLRSSPIYRTFQESQVFRGWVDVPTMVCITLVVPRRKLQELEELGDFEVCCPILWCEINSPNAHTLYSTFHPTFGHIVSTGTHDQRQLSIEEDSRGWSSASDLVVTFWAPALVVTLEPTVTQVSFTVRLTLASQHLKRILHPEFQLFTAELLDKNQVYITRERPSSSGEVEKIRAIRLAHFNGPTAGKVGVQMDKTCTHIASFTRRANISDAKAQEALINGASVSEEQVSACAIRITFGGFEEMAFFPFPVDGTRTRLRIGRKSHYIEVVTMPISETSSPGDVFVNQLPIVLHDTIPTLWNIHRLNLDRLPALDTSDKVRLTKWLFMHISFSFSDREMPMPSADGLVNQDVSDTLTAVKKTLRKLFLEYTGIQGPGTLSVFAFRDPTRGGIYALLFVTALRLDLPAHTVALDAYALSLTPPRVQRLQRFLSGLECVSVDTAGAETYAWKCLLPMLAERCRTAWTHRADCAYVRSGGTPFRENAEDPLCGCGEGRDSAAFARFPEWADAAPFVTRVAISPFFAVSYLETVGLPNEMTQWRTIRQTMQNSAPAETVGGSGCASCGRSEAKLVCSRCKHTKYCSAECQGVDWKQHKKTCK